MSFSSNLNNLIKSHNITNKKLSEILEEEYGYKISKESIAKYRNGTRTPEPKFVSLVANHLGITEQDIFDPSKKEQIAKDEISKDPAKYLKDVENFNINGIPQDLKDFVNDFLSLNEKEQEMYYYEIKAKALRNKAQ